jgi:hypothetical protein
MVSALADAVQEVLVRKHLWQRRTARIAMA